MGRRPPPGNRPRLKGKTPKARPKIIPPQQIPSPNKIKISPIGLASI
jgi:hypothetical protein